MYLPSLRACQNFLAVVFWCPTIIGIRNARQKGSREQAGRLRLLALDTWNRFLLDSEPPCQAACSHLPRESGCGICYDDTNACCVRSECAASAHSVHGSQILAAMQLSTNFLGTQSVHDVFLMSDCHLVMESALLAQTAVGIE